MARLLYRETKKGAFNSTHCYEVLKNHPRWLALVEKPTSVSGTAIATEESRDESERPRGSKAAKASAQQKRKLEDTLASFLENQKRANDDHQERARLNQAMADHRIISFDVSSIPNERKRRCLEMLAEEAMERVEKAYTSRHEQRERTVTEGPCDGDSDASETDSREPAHRN